MPKLFKNAGATGRGVMTKLNKKSVQTRKNKVTQTPTATSKSSTSAGLLSGTR